MQKILIGIGVVSALVVAVLWYVAYQARHEEPEVFACTMEALLCPDGSAVGRSGPNCVFMPCPDQSSFTGKLAQEGGAFVLDIPSVGMTGERFTLPLEIADVATAQALVGRVVVVTGTFKEGSTLTVATLVMATAPDEPPEGDAGLTTLRVGETKRVGGMRITLDEVVSDSRCPVDVQCITAGSVSLSVTIANDGGSEVYEMRSDEPAHSIGRFQVSIADVMPVPVSTGTIDPNEYRVTFRIEPLQAPSPIEAYLREHITELSPAKAVLGGTFYVTAVRQSSDTTAVVDYEDGHIALTADVVFSTTSDGEVTVEDFVVRRQ